MANRLGLETEVAGDYPVKHNARERKLAETIREDKNIVDTFQQALVVGIANNDGGGNVDLAAEPAVGIELAANSGKAAYEFHVTAIESTGTAVWQLPYVSADGLELNLDDDATDGVVAWEMTNGITSRSKAAMTIGTDPAFFAEATIKIDDISDVTELCFGLRKAAAYTVDKDDYTDAAMFSIGKDADGQIEIHTILNNAATTETDTTLTDWVDAGEHTLRVEVDSEGRCKFLLDGVEPTVTASFTFDSGDVVVPFLQATNEVGDPGISISSWKIAKL